MRGGEVSPAAHATSDQRAELLALAESVAVEAGQLLLEGRASGDVRVAATKSTPTDVVTQMDTAAERLIRTRLAAARPDDAVVGEEGGASGGDSGVTWVVDPLDGTVNYLYGLPVWSVSVAAEVAGEVVAGVVVCPPTQETWTATLGGGARLDGVPIRVSRVDTLDQTLVGTGFWYDATLRERQARLLRGLLPRVRDIRRIGSAAVDLCGVGCGRLDAFYESGLHRWDYAAGLLVAQEAGAGAGGPRGQAPDTRLTVAAAPGVFESLHELLLELGADSIAG